MRYMRAAYVVLVWGTFAVLVIACGYVVTIPELWRSKHER